MEREQQGVSEHHTESLALTEQQLQRGRLNKPELQPLQVSDQVQHRASVRLCITKRGRDWKVRGYADELQQRELTVEQTAEEKYWQRKRQLDEDFVRKSKGVELWINQMIGTIPPKVLEEMMETWDELTAESGRLCRRILSEAISDWLEPNRKFWEAVKNKKEYYRP